MGNCLFIVFLAEQPGVTCALKLLIGGFFVSVSICLASSLAQGEQADVASGRQFAEKNCARCHAVGRAGASAFEPAPPFRTLAKRWPLENLEEALAEGIVVGHSDMPEFKLSPRQIDNFLDYLKTIQNQ